MRLKQDCKKNKKSEALTFRLTQKELNNIKRSALTYCEGNISEFILFAATHFIPDKSDLIEKEKPSNK